MAITYQLKAPDFEVGARYLVQNHKIIRQQFRTTEIASLATAIIMVIILPYFIFREQYVLTVLISSLLMTAYYLWFRAHLRRSFIKRFVKLSTNGDQNFSRNVSLQLTDNGIASKTDLGIGELFWSSIQNVDEDEKYIYLLLPPSNLMVIPKAGFQSPDSSDVFIQEVKQRIAIQ